jgi:hypothetical protein
MSLGPRVVFMRFLDDESPKLKPWIAHTASVLSAAANVIAAPSPTAASDGDGSAVWHLVSANNRELARGVGIHPTFVLARKHAERVVALGDRIVVEPVSEPARGVYGWYASIDGEPVMTCARWYVTDRDRRHSGELAARSIAAAVLLAGSRLTDPTLMGGRRGATD